MTGSRTKAPDLTMRLIAADIRNMIAMVEEGIPVQKICDKYGFSYSSWVRIFTPWNWTRAQRHHWDYENLPKVNWPENYRRPKKSYPGKKPKIKKSGFVHNKNTEFETGADDATRYAKDNKSRPSLKENIQAPEPETTLSDLVTENDKREAVNSISPVPMKKIIEIMDGPDTDLIENSPAEKYFDKLPELETLFPTPRDHINRQELIHRLIQVECCFDLMAEEYAKLKAFLKK
jgi:hypothetical protein